jgi:endonuclease G, mitochondrial
MAPQAPNLNRGIWKNLETQVRTWAKASGEVRVITGPIFSETSKHIGPDNVVVPDKFFKIVVDETGDRTEAIAFEFENHDYDQTLPFDGFVVSIDQIEDETGFDFMPQLSSAEEARLERNAAAMWDPEVGSNQ